MFSIQNKIDNNLKTIIANKYCKSVRVIVKCNSLFESIEKKITGSHNSLIWSIPSINCICCSVSLNFLQRLLEYPQVSFICEDNFAYLCGLTDNICKNGLSLETANKVNLHNKYRLTGKNIGIGIIDSGVYPHTDFLNPFNKISKFEDYVNNLKYPYDDLGHGTALCGILSGNGALSNKLYKGIADNSHLYCIKAFNSIGKGYISDILHGIEQITLKSSELNIKIICLPFELTNCCNLILSLFEDLFEKAASAGLTIVVPSGHNGNSECSIRGIATLKNCITVGGIDTTHGIKPYIYSSFGLWGRLEKPDIAAACTNLILPASDTNYLSERNGSKVYPQHLDKPYTCFSGTSAAAAYIAGICALLYENNINYNFKDILSLLKASCNLSEISKYAQGAGIPCLDKLLL